MTGESRPADGNAVGSAAHPPQSPRLFLRQGDHIIEASPDDVKVAKRYPRHEDKGAVVGGQRIAILCSKQSYRVNEEVRVIHVLEVVEPGHELYIMGPKRVCREYVDGRRVTPDDCDDDITYDGRVLESPGIDYNYEITTYRFVSPGHHEIYWERPPLRSNTLHLQVVSA